MASRYRVSVSAGAVLLIGLTTASARSSADPAPGFKHGNEFNATRISGNVNGWCMNGGPENGENFFFSCAASLLEPVETDRFVAKVDADQVTLKAVHQDGSSREKKVRFHAARGESDLVNLWISTLTQRPLLEVGQNLVSYSFLKQGQTVTSGELTVPVHRLADRHCPGMTLHLSYGNCTDQTYVCEKYFEKANYCK